LLRVGAASDMAWGEALSPGEGLSAVPGGWGEGAEELLDRGEGAGHGVLSVLEELSELRAESKAQV